MARLWQKMADDPLVIFDRITENTIGQMVNISVNGAMLVSDKSIEIPSVFACSMELPQKSHRSQPMEFDIQAKWCKPNNNTGMYETGYQFVNLSDENKKIVQDILERYTLKNNKPDRTPKADITSD